MSATSAEYCPLICAASRVSGVGEVGAAAGLAPAAKSNDPQTIAEWAAAEVKPTVFAEVCCSACRPTPLELRKTQTPNPAPAYWAPKSSVMALEPPDDGLAVHTPDPL